MSIVVRQPDLFDKPNLSGLSQADAIVTPDQEQVLIGAIDAEQLSPFRFHGWLGKRLTASYGWRYDFDTAAFAPTEAIPDWLLPVRARAAWFAGLESGTSSKPWSSATTRAPGSAGTATVRCSSMSSASRLARRR
jgi:hypothetical protein